MPSPVDNDAGFQISWNSHFSRYIQDNWKNGMNIDKVPSKYVTEDILTKYWTTDTVTKIKNECRTPIPITPEIILASLVRVWSALVFIGRPEFITWFHQNGRDDEFFFSTGFSGTADQDLALQGMLKDLREHWGKFWPVRLKPPYMHQRLLESQRVLPIHSWRELSQPDSGSRTTIHEVKLDPLCCEESNRTVVFKLYTNTNTDPSASLAFRKEADVFGTLGQSCKGVIVDYLGSFIQNGKSVLVLEHANGGNLWDFFKTYREPRNNEELIYLWRKLFRLSEAVYHLHNAGTTDLSIAHRDIKFENILFFRQGNKEQYKFEFKLTDFDTSTPPQNAHNGLSHQDNDGSRTHCAPEASRILDHTESKSERIPLDSDVWQLGAVFSEALICILWGWQSLSEYQERRKNETSTFKKLAGGGFELCFHDGHKRLDCIQKIHEEALNSRKQFDMISKSLVALIEDEMLVPHGEGRLDSKLLSVRFEQLLARRQRDSAAPNVSIHGSERRHTRTQTSPGAVPGVRDAHEGPEHAHRHDQTRISQQSFKTIQSFVQDTNYQIDQMITETSEASQETMSELRSDLSRESISHNRRADTKVDHEDSKAQKEPRTPRIPMLTTNDVDLWRANKRLGTSPPPAPPGLEEIIEQLQGRDQLFVIDDAESMKRHLPSLKSVAEAMISLAKKADPDGVELIFTSKPKEVKRKSFFTFKSETDDLVKQIIARFGKDKLPGSTSMENKLGVILDRIDWTGSRTSVYVLTDGVWMDSGDPGGGVENPIKSLVSRLKRGHLMRDAVTIQFIQFGNDQRGSDRLAWLDDELPKSGPEYRDFDIVDTRKHHESLYLLMIGALRHYIDEVETGKVG